MYDPYVTQRADRPRSAGASERARARRGRPALVAAIDLRPEGDRPAAPVHPAGDLVPQRVRLRQRALPGGRRGDRDRVGTDLGGVRRRRGFSRKVGMSDSDVPPFGRGGRGQRRGHPCGGGRHGAAGRAVLQRQHQPGRRDHVGRRGHGEVDDRAARLRAGGRRRPALLRREREAALARGDPHADRRPAGRMPGLAAPPPHMAGYALGLNVRDYRGRTLLPAHRRAAGLPLQGRHDPRATARRRRAHQPGVRARRSSPSPTTCSITTSAPRRRTIRRCSTGWLAKAQQADGRGARSREAATARDSTSGPSLPLAALRRHLPRPVVRRRRHRARTARDW